MTIGLLLCDEVAPDLLDEHGTYQAMFETLIPDLTFQVYPVFQKAFPLDVKECDGYLVNGSRYSVYDDIDWIHQLKEFVCEIHAEAIPYVGVCFGHQLLAQALGGLVRPSPNGWSVGIHSFQIDQFYPWMHPPATAINLLMMCQDQVVTLPPSSEIIAATINCPVGMFMVSDRMLGIQAHPEFTRAYDAALIKLRKSRIGEEQAISALNNLSDHLNSSTMASWICNFFEEKC